MDHKEEQVGEVGEQYNEGFSSLIKILNKIASLNSDNDVEDLENDPDLNKSFEAISKYIDGPRTGGYDRANSDQCFLGYTLPATMAFGKGIISSASTHGTAAVEKSFLKYQKELDEKLLYYFYELEKKHYLDNQEGQGSEVSGYYTGSEKALSLCLYSINSMSDDSSNREKMFSTFEKKLTKKGKNLLDKIIKEEERLHVDMELFKRKETRGDCTYPNKLDLKSAKDRALLVLILFMQSVNRFNIPSFGHSLQEMEKYNFFSYCLERHLDFEKEGVVDPCSHYEAFRYGILDHWVSMQESVPAPGSEHKEKLTLKCFLSNMNQKRAEILLKLYQRKPKSLNSSPKPPDSIKKTTRNLKGKKTVEANKQKANIIVTSIELLLIIVALLLLFVFNQPFFALIPMVLILVVPGVKYLHGKNKGGKEYKITLRVKKSSTNALTTKTNYVSLIEDKNRGNYLDDEVPATTKKEQSFY